jgi:hypothetical protein
MSAAMADRRYEKDGLIILASKLNTRSVFTWRGVSDARNPGAFLLPLFNELVEFAQGSDVTVDFSRLEFLNSATVGPMLQLVKQLATGDRAVQVVFATSEWQRPHLKCTTVIARTLQNVTVEGRAVSGYSVPPARSTSGVPKSSG